MLGGVQMKYQGIVLSLTKNRAIVSTNDFECFYINRNSTIYVGKEIEFSDKEIIRNKPALSKLMVSVACILLVIICYTAFSTIPNLFSKPEVFAYVDVDINPSLEIQIDRAGKVLKLVPLNKDAEELISDLKTDDMEVSEAVDIILDKVKKEKLLGETSNYYVLISSTLNNRKNGDDKEYQNEKQKLDTIMNTLKDEIQEKDEANVIFIQSTINERKDAQNEGISTGRYALYNKYKDLDDDFSIEDAKTANVNELLQVVIDEEKQAPTQKPTASPTSKPTPTAKAINMELMKFESYNYRGMFIRHKDFKARISSKIKPFEDCIFKIVPGLADPECISFESKNFPGYYLKHENFKIILKQYDKTDTFYADATFRVVPGLADENLISFQSYNYPDRYIRHKEFYLWIDPIVTELERKDATYFNIEVK